MALSENAKKYLDKMFPDDHLKLTKTDPEFAELFSNFAFDEVVNEGDLDDRTRFITILATLIGCQGKDAYKAMVPAAINFGVKPVEIKEIVYQAVAYLGIGRVLPFLKVTNKVFKKQGIKLPLEPQSTTTTETRLEAGEDAQVKIFGEGMKGFWNAGRIETRHINRWLTDNCFGDYYTRRGFTYAERELITFCFLAAQGGAEPQLTSHVKANLRNGNSKELLIEVISQNIPYIGYPRSLNALRCVQKATQEMLN